MKGIIKLKVNNPCTLDSSATSKVSFRIGQGEESRLARNQRFTYPGDNNELLQLSQRIDSKLHVRAIIDNVIKTYNFSSYVMDSDKRLREYTDNHDTNVELVFEKIYDLICAIYRYEHDDAGQWQLFSEKPQIVQYREEWRKWLLKQTDELFENSEFVRLAALIIRDEKSILPMFETESSILNVTYHQLACDEINLIRS